MLDGTPTKRSRPLGREKQTPKTGAHGRRKEDAEKKTDTEKKTYTSAEKRKQKINAHAVLVNDLVFPFSKMRAPRDGSPPVGVPRSALQQGRFLPVW